MAPGKPTLDDEFLTFSKDRTRIRCATCKLPADVRDWVDDKIRAGVPAAALAAFLNQKGYVVSTSAVANHRNNHVS